MMPESDYNVISVKIRPSNVGSTTTISPIEDSESADSVEARQVRFMNTTRALPLPIVQTSSSKAGSAPIYTTSPLSLHDDEKVLTESKVFEMTNSENIASRQLNKLKKFLTTLQKFSFGISLEVGERVNQFIIDVVTQALTIEDFNKVVSHVTNYPLRPFVIPFLKASLPCLQQLISHMVLLLKITPQQYLYQNEYLLSRSKISKATNLSFNEFSTESNRPHKRKLQDERKSESGYNEQVQSSQSPSKRGETCVIKCNSQEKSLNTSQHTPSIKHQLFQLNEIASDVRRDRQIQEPRLTGNRDIKGENDEDEWKNIYTMLNCILGMVNKTKKALAILQERNSINISHNEFEQPNSISWSSTNTRTSPGIGNAKRPKISSNLNESLQIFSPSEESNITRQAEDDLKDLKIQAVVELQKAVAAAEAKANKIVTNERLKMDKMIDEARQQAAESAFMMANKQQDSTENCWNCGRKAHETCSGCNSARYCGSFCQHKDWENHHKVCGKNQSQKEIASSSSSPNTNIISSTLQSASDDEVEKQ